MAGEYDEIDEIAHLWMKAQQHPRGPALMCGRILTGMAPASFNVPVQDLMGCDERDADAVKASLIGCTDDLLAFWHKLLAVGEQLTFTASGAKKRAPTCRQAHYQALWLRQREVQEQLERLDEEDDGLEV